MKFPRPTPSAFTYCKLPKTGGVGNEVRLNTFYSVGAHPGKVGVRLGQQLPQSTRCRCTSTIAELKLIARYWGFYKYIQLCDSQHTISWLRSCYCLISVAVCEQKLGSSTLQTCECNFWLLPAKKCFSSRKRFPAHVEHFCCHVSHCKRIIISDCLTNMF